MSGASVPDRAALLDAYAVPRRDERLLRMNFVASLDGAVTIRGRSGGLGDASDRLAMEVLRTLADVVLVGAGTVRVEGYGGLRLGDEAVAWREANGLEPQPRFAIVSGRLDLDPGHPVFAEAVTRPLVLTRDAAPPDRRDALADVADVIMCGDSEVEPDRMLGALEARGLRQVLCEGGPHLFGALLSAGVVDELCLSLSPLLVAGSAGRIVAGATEAARPMSLVHALAAGDLLLLRYRRADG